ncbi:adenylosuccinate synthase [bacterium]|nr:adenylosuccinate synthase [bacterium]
MPFTVVVGGQWGDEGKGRIVDALARDAWAVARFQGGPNAGHTVYIGEEKFVLHLVPMGVLNPNTLCCIGLGVLIDPIILLYEIETLKSRGIDLTGRLLIDPRCHLILPAHIKRDQEHEKALGDKKIGTTLRGIGPAFADRTTRVGHNISGFLKAVKNGEKFDIDENYIEKCLKLEPYLDDVSLTLYQYLRANKNIMAEGGQGTMLDLGLGTYPFVTATNTVAGAAAVNLGLGANTIDRVVCVIKAYTTRVGEGPFPTELADSLGEIIRKVGGEYGATTGRPRRCGWFDGLIARYAARVNGVNRWAVTKLDVLDDLDVIKAAVAYKIKGEIIHEIPADPALFVQAEPIYREFPGWKRSIKDARKVNQLPPNALNYLDFIEEFTGVKIGMVSVGYERKSLIMIDS